MTLQDFNQILVIVLLVVLIGAIIVVVVQLSRTLKTLTLILEDTHNVTEKVSNFTDHPEKIQLAIESRVNDAIENVVVEQSNRLRRTFARDFLGSLVDGLRSRNY